MRNVRPEALTGRPALGGLRVTVTGGAGFIGSRVVAALVRTGARVRVLDDLSTGRFANLRAAMLSGLTRSEVSVCDIRTAAATREIRSWAPAVVVHLAAQTSLPAARLSPQADVDINVGGTVNVLEACRQAGTETVVYAASCAGYGLVPGHRLPVGEGEECRPTGPYGLSKLTALRYVEMYRDCYGLGCSALVLGNVYGPRAASPDAGVIARMSDSVLRGVPPVIFGDGRQTRDFVHVDDVVRAVLSACARRPVGTVNVASGVGSRIVDVLETVNRAARRRIPAVHHPGRPGDVRDMVLDIGRAAEVLDWRPEIGLARGVGDLVRRASHDQPLHLDAG